MLGKIPTIGTDKVLTNNDGALSVDEGEPVPPVQTVYLVIVTADVEASDGTVHIINPTRYSPRGLNAREKKAKKYQI